MISLEAVTSLKDLLNATQTVMVVLGNKVTFDQAAAASALYLALKASAKDAVFLAPNNLGQNFRSLAGIEQLKQDIGNQNLVLSFDYSEAQVDKVSYHIGEESSKFYLTIRPQKGHKPLDAKAVEFSYTGAESDLIFLLGVHDYEALDKLYFGYESLFADNTVVTIHNFKPEIGNVKLDVSNKVCMSEGVFELIEGLELALDSDIATNLLTAIEASSEHFSSLSATAETFETVAKLLRLGARRVKKPQLSKAGHQPVLIKQSGKQPSLRPSRQSLERSPRQSSKQPSKQQQFAKRPSKQLVRHPVKPADFRPGSQKKLREKKNGTAIY